MSKAKRNKEQESQIKQDLRNIVNEALIKEAIRSVNAFMIAKYEKQIKELQERVEILKHIEL